MPVSRKRLAELQQVTWQDHVAKWRDCSRCPLSQQRGRICLARGTVPCDVLFIGEAPGASEDALGQPFKGPAGLLLDCRDEDRPGIVQRALPSHLEWSEETQANVWKVDVPCAFTNLVACFPRWAKSRGDNEPEVSEIKACTPRLVEFVRLCRPRLIVLVGTIARRHVYGSAQFRLDGEAAQPEWILEGHQLHFLDIVHPAHILAHMPAVQKTQAVNKCVVQIKNAWEDMLELTKSDNNSDKENNGANLQSTTAEQLRADYERWRLSQDHDDSDIPF